MEYAIAHVKQDIKRLPEYKDLVSWDLFQKALKREYKWSDSEQLLHTVGYLEKIVKEFKTLVDTTTVTQSRIHQYCREFHEVATNCLAKGDITDKALTFKFIYALPQNLKIRAMRYAAKGNRFDPDDMKPFIDVYNTIETSCAVLKHMDDIVEEQGMGGLPSKYASMKPGFAAAQWGQLPNQVQPTAESSQGLLSHIQAKVMKSTKPISNQDIDDITAGLDKLHILQAIAERAQGIPTVADVNFLGHSNELWEYEEEAEVNFGGYQGRSQYTGQRRDYQSEEICKWCKNIQKEDIRPQAPYRYMN